MQVKLKVLQGQLQNQAGSSAGPVISVKRRRFVFGSAPDCHMCCKSRSIRSYHCVMLIEDTAVTVRDLGSDTGTFVNDERLTAERTLQVGDRLRVGKLEFQILFERPRLQTTQGDAVDRLVTDLLVNADNVEREQRRHNPDARRYVDSGSKINDQTVIVPEAAKKTVIAKKPPGKLPQAPNIKGKNTIDAAQQALERHFQTSKHQVDR